jgi:MerR family transcriptional regulator, redox-sensitive transcriptional activator SoxR
MLATVVGVGLEVGVEVEAAVAGEADEACMGRYGRTSTMVEVKVVEVKGVEVKGVEVKGGLRRLSVGELAARAGVATSALRFYEANGLIHSERNASGHRRYRPDALRRVAFIRVAQRIGLSLGEVASALDSLPSRRTPTRDDWNDLSSRWLPRIDEQIAALEMLRDRLDGCIGCGCLSLDTCELYNVGDRAADRGAGARYLLGDPIETETEG